MKNPIVLIIGAGPVGLTLAAELVRYGVSVRIVDKNAERTDKSKALVVWSRTLELLARGGLAGTFIEAGMKVIAANVIGSGKLIGHVGLTEVKSPYPYALMLPQSETERILEEHLSSLGVIVERQVEAVTFTQTANEVTTTLRHADGREETLASAWLIGADGAHSIVRHTLGLTFEGTTLLSDWVLADIHLTGLQYPQNELAMFWHQDGALAVFPISPGRYRVIADIGHSDAAKPAEPTLAQVQALVDQRGPGGVVVSNPIWLAGFRINERKVPDYRRNRVFLMGDAAHVHSPAGGQGMNTGMQDAFNLAWKLALVARGIGKSPTLLESYSIERSAVGDQVLANANRLTSVAILKSHPLQAVRNFVGSLLFGLSSVRRGMADQLSEISIGYPHSPLNDSHGDNGDLKPGRRAPVSVEAVAVGAGDTPRFALFGAPGPATEALLQAHPDLLENTLRSPLQENELCLVRPDGYIACVGESEKIEKYLRTIKGA